jgi:hypothetical protein
LVAAEPGETIGESDDDRWHALFPDQAVEPLRQVLAKAGPICMRQAAAGEADKIQQQGQPLPVMSSRDVHVDDARRWIAQHIALEDVAFDGDSADCPDRPREPAHASRSWLLLI